MKFEFHLDALSVVMFRFHFAAPSQEAVKPDVSYEHDLASPNWLPAKKSLTGQERHLSWSASEL